MTTPVATLDQGMARGLVAFRSWALVWAWVGLVVERDHSDQLWVGIVGLGLATVLTVAALRTLGAAFTPARRRRLAGVEVVLGGCLLIADAWVYNVGREQSLPWAWPAAGVIAVALAYGLTHAVTAAVLLSVASFAGESLLRDDFQWTVSSASKSALLVLAAISGAAVARVMRQAEAEISSARAREEMGRVLHDGVLQTLAVVQRRSEDADLRSLAKDQERDLRRYLYDAPSAPTGFVASLRAAAAEIERREKVEVAVVLADDLPEPSASVGEAIVGAAKEALTNAAKHGGGDRISLFAEPDESGVYCTVNDNGVGFDVSQPSHGRGLEHSIRRRITEVGGRVTISSKPGHGTEVELWVP